MNDLESKPIPGEVKVIRRIVQGVQSPGNRVAKTQEELLAEATRRLNGHRLAPFHISSFHEAFRIAFEVHNHVAGNPENANSMVLPFKTALLNLVRFADYSPTPSPFVPISQN